MAAWLDLVPRQHSREDRTQLFEIGKRVTSNFAPSSSKVLELLFGGSPRRIHTPNPASAV